MRPVLNLPLIDIGDLHHDDPAAHQKIAQQLRDACQRCGFFYIHNHGIDAELIAAVQQQAERFFALPSAAKLALDKALSGCNRGYEPLRGQTLEAGSPPDLKEGFYIGNEVAADDPRVLAGKFNQGPNQWPAELADFRPVMERYFQAANAVCERLMAVLALSLELPGDHFAPLLKDAAATLRLLHYPPQPTQPAPGEKGCGAHTDFGALTLLLQDDAGGLQVQAIDGEEWIDAPPIEGTYVVNLGDLISRWTNDRYRSNRHRVINRSGRERYSVPFFYTGNLDLTVECLPVCLAPAETPRYPAVTVEEHLREMYRRTYG